MLVERFRVAVHNVERSPSDEAVGALRLAAAPILDTLRAEYRGVSIRGAPAVSFRVGQGVIRGGTTSAGPSPCPHDRSPSRSESLWNGQSWTPLPMSCDGRWHAGPCEAALLSGTLRAGHWTGSASRASRWPTSTMCVPGSGLLPSRGSGQVDAVSSPGPRASCSTGRSTDPTVSADDADGPGRCPRGEASRTAWISAFVTPSRPRAP